ncbi:alpha-keto acid decarboxylase family protein [Methylococcus sp. EFPC2]|uniref:alpha-keto acid decarboxylase family protein n=1 Tax=Methylococcus sp. EFPC2 TaxID=2812648 RepID=UPI0019673366|nr:thiamine pyrophosphate-binding protein [Methylococcus sp. EFPC2]QSA97710.1 alpha-keto acid decarboxylase family protein [Methylococcus sp. EFPC2]
MSPAESDTIGRYLLQRLYEEGVRDIFGVPGDYVLGFYDLMANSPIRHIGTTREDTAAFAADGYARCRGLGALAVTYGVGALNTVNAVAGAYAESAPVVVISGAPGVREQREDPLLHHRFGPFNFQREIFERITCATAVLDDPLMALRQIDRVLVAARRQCKPVYIEIPRDRVATPGYPVPAEAFEEEPASDAAALAEAVAETVELMGQAVSPMLVAGVELHRRGLQDALIELVERAHLPVAATLTGKSVIAERHPAYLGIYEGAMSAEGARYTVEQSDLLLMLGVTLNDVDTGIYTARLDPRRIVRASQDEVVIHHHRYPRVALADFVLSLAQSAGARADAYPAAPAVPEFGFPEPNRPMAVERLIARLDRALTPEMIVVCDVGDCLFAALDLRVHERSEFLASAFYTSMGYAVPAALGAQIARPDHRALILVGDGAFQMTGTELSTHARYGLAPIVVVFNNRGYSTERFILEGPFNDIASWNFDRLGEVFGPLRGYDAPDEQSFEIALLGALAEHTQPSIINVHLPQTDASAAMQRLAAHLHSRVQG